MTDLIRLLKSGAIHLLFKRLRLALFSVILLLLISELGLRVGHAIVMRRQTRADLTVPGASVVLCIGDSHTYGFGVRNNETYPAQLEEKLRTRGCPVNVVNRGVPGSNTSQMRRNLRDWLRVYRPAVVMLLGSVNNGWNIKDIQYSDWQDGYPVPWTRKIAVFCQDNIRIVRALSIFLDRPGEYNKLEVAFDREGRLLRHEEDADWLKNGGIPVKHDRTLRDLRAMASMIRKTGAIPVLLTYIAPGKKDFVGPNTVLRYIAGTVPDVGIIDVAEALAPVFLRDDGGVDMDARNRLLLPDFHPSAEGYDVMTDLIVDRFEASGVMDLLRLHPAE